MSDYLLKGEQGLVCEPRKMSNFMVHFKGAHHDTIDKRGIFFPSHYFILEQFTLFLDNTF